MIEYILIDGTSIKVAPENEEQFKLDNPDATLKSTVPGKDKSSTEGGIINCATFVFIVLPFCI